MLEAGMLNGAKKNWIWSYSIKYKAGRPGRPAVGRGGQRAGNKKCERKGGAQNEEDFFIFLDW